MPVRVGIPAAAGPGRVSHLRGHSGPAVDLHDHGQAAQTVQAVREALRQGGMEPVDIDLEQPVPSARQARVDVVFPLLPTSGTRLAQPALVAQLESAGVPFVGSELAAQTAALHKDLAKKLLAWEGIATPPFQVFHGPGEDLRDGLSFPLLVKPCREGSSLGLWADSLVRDRQGLRRAVARVLRVCRQPALVEAFVDGAEFTVGVLADGGLRVLPICRIDFNPLSRVMAGHGPFYSREAKARDAARIICPAPVPRTLQAVLERAARGAFRALGCRHLARVDIRLDAAGTPHVLELNALPGLHPELSDFPRMARAAGRSYPELICLLVASALEESARPLGPVPPGVTAPTG